METLRRQMNYHEFSRLFKTKKREVQSGIIWDCYGTWDDSDVSCQGDTEENSRIEAYNYLLKNHMIITNEENERRNNVLASYASQAKPQRTTPDVIDLETAIKAKELGFKEPCIWAYDKCDMLCTDLQDGLSKINYNSSGYMHSAPFKKDYQKWLDNI